jgi:hypothetical protein
VIPQRLWWVLALPVVGGDHPLHCVHESGADVGRVSHDCRLAGRCLERDSWGSGQCSDYVLCVVATAFTCVCFQDAVNFICDDPYIKAISFVGSGPAGKHIFARWAFG